MDYKEYRDKEKELNDFLLKMSNEEYDKYMCSKYPDFFRDRSLPPTESCMYFGFSVGHGWHNILDKACRYVKLIQKVTGIGVIFDQIKEKYGSARFYSHADISDESKLSYEEQLLWGEIVSDIISDAERKTEHICAECGEYYCHESINVGCWYYDVCEECFVKLYPDRIDQYNRWKELTALREEIGWTLNSLDDSEVVDIKNVIEKCKKRLERK